MSHGARRENENGNLTADQFDAYPAAVAVLASDGRIRIWNAAAGALLGYGRDEVVGQEFESLIIPPGEPDERQAAMALARTGEPVCITGERRHRDGTDIPVTISFEAGTGALAGHLFVTMRDLRAARCLCGASGGTSTRKPLKALTTRQRQVLKLIAEGRSTREIAERLTLSVKTVETHRGHLMQRLKLKSVAGLVR